MTKEWGDYQDSASRMAKKRQAIPLPNLEGKRVLDVGCDYGYWCKLASDAGATCVLGIDRGREVRGQGFVNVAAHNRAKKWPYCEFQCINLGQEWPMLGEFDVVFCFSLYHHWYGETGNHDRIWQWLAMHVAPSGMLLWEGPVDTKDSMARRCSARVGDYIKESILVAARRYFKKVEIIGPALHRPHREVWRCTHWENTRGTSKDSGHSMQRVRKVGAGIHGREDGGGLQLDGMVAVSRDTECKSVGSTEGSDKFGSTSGGDGARHEDRSAMVVERTLRIRRPQPHRRARRTRRQQHDELSRASNAATPEVLVRPERRRSSLVHPEWALVLGGGSNVWDEVLEWEEIYGKQWDGMVVAANDVGCHWPRDLDHWCSLHPDKFRKGPNWEGQRAAYGFNTTYATWGRKARFTDYAVIPWAGGASGMLAVQVAQAVGCVRVVLCGVPMEPTPHFVESTLHKQSQPWKAVEGHWRAWQKHHNKFTGWVKSMSGRTAALLGKPTMEWLLEEAAQPKDHPGLSEFELLKEMTEER